MNKKHLFPIAGLFLMTVFSFSFTSCQKKVTGVKIYTDGFIDNPYFFEGTHRWFDAVIYPKNASDKSLTWKSSNTEVATIDKAGYMMAHTEGQTNIICKTNDGNFTDSCTIYIIGNYISHVMGIYKGNVTINDTLIIADVTLNLFNSSSTPSLTYNEGTLEMQFNTNNIYCSYKTFFENDQYKIKGNETETSDMPAISCEGVFNDQGSARISINIETKPITHLVFTGEKQAMSEL
ncbi:MAG: Ig-like domain-containing protein [Bacteroidales bacterium]|jgi:hypothetical protein|nr:Ig-like domain-containing protein [Bacteroidales bacterium]